MAELLYTEAAKRVGIARSTLYRHINEGKVSTKKNRSGENVIDTSELIRAYGELKSYDTSDDTSEKDAAKHRENGETVPLLRQKVEFLERENERLEKDILERKQREEKLETELDAERVERRAAQRLLEDKRKEREALPEVKSSSSLKESVKLVIVVGVTTVGTVSTVAVLLFLLLQRWGIGF